LGKIVLAATAKTVGSEYPSPYDLPCLQRLRHTLGDAAGLTQFGVNLQRLAPGGWSSQRHWHSSEDEFVWVLQGELVLVTDQGEETMVAGDCAGFKAGTPDGHHLQNRSQYDALILEIGTRHPAADVASYPDIDLRWCAGGYLHKDGSRY
jgi:uncharacterized cupin superfamily protein